MGKKEVTPSTVEMSELEERLKDFILYEQIRIVLTKL